MMCHAALRRVIGMLLLLETDTCPASDARGGLVSRMGERRGLTPVAIPSSPTPTPQALQTSAHEWTATGLAAQTLLCAKLFDGVCSRPSFLSLSQQDADESVLGDPGHQGADLEPWRKTKAVT